MSLKNQKKIRKLKIRKITGKKKELNHSSENAGQEIKISRTKDKVNSDTSKDDEKNKFKNL